MNIMDQYKIPITLFMRGRMYILSGKWGGGTVSHAGYFVRGGQLMLGHSVRRTPGTRI